jgi:hypothetical protein
MEKLSGMRKMNRFIENIGREREKERERKRGRERDVK